MTTKAEWLEQAIRSQAIAQKITELLNDLARSAPSIDAQIYGPGFRINGHGGDFHVDSLLSDNDLRAIAQMKSGALAAGARWLLRYLPCLLISLYLTQIARGIKAARQTGAAR